MAGPNPYDPRERAGSSVEDSTEILDSIGRKLVEMGSGVDSVVSEEEVAMGHIFAVLAVIFGAIGLAAESWVSFVCVAVALALGVVWLSRRPDPVDVYRRAGRKR